MTTQQENLLQSETNSLTGSALEDVLYSNEHVRVSRRRQADSSTLVIVKQAIDLQAGRRLKHETDMLKRLSHIEGIVKIADTIAEPNTLVLKDEGGIALATYLNSRQLTVPQCVDYMTALAGIIAQVHKSGIIHKDICPANLLIHPTTLAPTLIDFNIAGDLANESASGEAGGALAGTLAYMSPEQTGRTGRAADQRSDLYSLGITFYELLTHRRAFESDDLLEMVHNHLVGVPDAPAVVNNLIPQLLSDVVMHLLEKEPDRRYQSAEGLIEDLHLIAAGMQVDKIEPFTLGRFDFGTRLAAPKTLLDREVQRTELQAAFDLARAGQSPVVFLQGEHGSGKSVLIDDFRAGIAEHRPWVVSVKYLAEDKSTTGTGTDSLQALGRQLLALPDEQLKTYRARILAALDGHMGIGASLLPEFQMLLGEHAAADLQPEVVGKRTALATLALLRSIASPEKPLVMIYDDLQWAPQLTLKSLDSGFTRDQAVPCLLMVCAFDSTAIDTNAEFGTMIQRWQAVPRIRSVVVTPLKEAAAAEFVGDILRIPLTEGRRLAEALALRSHHNPGRTLSLLDALRNDGLLVQNHGEWRWDAQALRRYSGDSSPAELAVRAASLPMDSRELLKCLACLGSLTPVATLCLATGWSEADMASRLAPAQEEGLVEFGDKGMDCANERVRSAAMASMTADQRLALHLSLARKLTASGQSELEDLATEQFLAAQDVLGDETERRRAAALMEAAAKRLRLTDPPASERYLAATIKALAPVSGASDADHLLGLKIDHHRALFEQGRLADGDTLYEDLKASVSDPTPLLEATRVQIYALMNRRRMADGMNLGLEVLDQIGLPKPDSLLPAIGEGFKRVTIWYRGEEKAREISERSEIADERVVALTKMIPETTNPAYFADITTWAWLTLECHRLWVEHGPSPRLISSIGAVQMMMVGTPQDYRGAYNIGRHALQVGEARGYEPATSFVRALFGISAAHWVDPIESVVDDVFLRSRADLKRQGDESFISYTYVVVDPMLDSKPTLEHAWKDLEEGLDMARRTKNVEFEQRYMPRRQFIKTLRGETATPGHFTSDDFDEAAYVEKIDPTSPTAATYHAFRAISAAIFGDLPTLALHIVKAVPLSARVPGYYITALVRTLQCLSLADAARALPAEERAPVLDQFDTHFKWLAARAADAPENYLHLQRWMEAERAWAADSVWSAGAAFDLAVAESILHNRPWHRALIHERAAIFLLAQGMEHTARPLMLEAEATYEAWGAVGKVKDLRRHYAFLRATSTLGGGNSGTRSTVVDTEMVDMMGVLRASQALSSETSLTRLTEAVGKVLGAITGATGVYLVVRPEEGSSTWVMASSLGEGCEPLTVEDAGTRGEVPLSAFRYAERTKELLVIDDAPSDDRFSADPYVEKFAQCSLVLAPILKQGHMNAMLVLENHQRRAAFSAERLNSVSMIAGQLAVSLDNALLYASLEKRVAERTAQLRQKTNDINAMLQNMPQGVMTVMAGGLIHPEYSAYLETIFETSEVANQPVMALVFPSTSLGADTLSQVDASIASCIGEDEMNFEFNSHLLVTEFDITLPDGRVKSLALSWSPIADDSGTVDKLMLCVRDVTELKRLESEANSRKRELQMIGEILAVSQEKFHPFMASARTFLDENRQLLEQTPQFNQEAINLLFRNMHTIKGNARTYDLLALTNTVHMAEQSYDDLRKSDEPVWDQATLLAELAGVKELLDTYSHVNDTVLGRKGPGRRGGVEKFLMVERDTVEQSMQMLMGVDPSDTNALRDAVQHVGSMLNMIGTKPINEVLAGTLDSLPSLAQELGKEVPTIGIADNGIVIRTQASGLLRNLFTHLLRNSVDHGIEAAEIRQAKGKPAAGHIQLDLAVNDGHLWIKLRDDGRGLAIGRIRERALALEMISAYKPTSSQDIAQLIFHSGFSTAEQVTEVSGRGVGMDAVKGFLEAEGGSIEIHFLDDAEGADFRPFETVIALPDKYSASLRAAMSFDALRARMQSLKSHAATAAAPQ